MGTKGELGKLARMRYAEKQLDPMTGRASLQRRLALGRKVEKGAPNAQRTPSGGTASLGPGELLKTSTLRSRAGGSTRDISVASLSSKSGASW